MKKSFTLAETLVTLAIIGVLIAILLPAVDSVRPDKDKITYKKALYSMQNAVANVPLVANVGAYWKASEIGDADFCNEVANALNTKGTINCSGISSYSNPNFITTDGIRYWGLEGKFSDSNEVRTIYADRNLSTNELNSLLRKRGRSGLGMQIQVRYDTKTGTNLDTSADTSYEDEMMDDSFQVTDRNYSYK